MGQQFLQNPGVDDALIRVPNALSIQVDLHIFGIAAHEVLQVRPVGSAPSAHFFELFLGHATGKLNALARCRDLPAVQFLQG